MLAVIMIRTAGRDQVYWFAGFRPAHGVSIGIDFEVQPLSAGLACLAAVLLTAAMTFSWRYFDRVATYYHALMLTFLAGITGFCLTGDLFDLFVWFELMGVSAYALTAYRPEERGPIQGALNFAITNSIGAYLSLSGIGLIYGRTGALNMAQIGVAIAKHPADRLVVVAFLLVIAGLLIKSAIVPFHFWLADAHAVAPTPVCVLFSGVMVELGLYGIARVYWSVFGQALGHRAAISHVFLGLGLLTAVAGALFCFRERHIKRMLAFSTISHAGMFLIGMALLTQLGLAGAAVYVIGHGLVKGALFLCTGIVLHRLGSVSEPWLHGRGRPLRVTGVVFTLAGLGLADLPPFATFLGKGWIEAGAEAWLIPVLVVCSALVGGAVLRVAGGVFYGLGDRPTEDPQMAKEAAEETSETTGGKDRTPLTMLIPPTVLVVATLVVGLIGQLGPAVQAAAVRFEDQAGYNATVLEGARLTHPVALSASGPASVTVADVLTGLGSVAGALILAWLALYWRRLPLLRGYRPNASVAAAARHFQSGVVNDYVTWIVIGLTCLGALFAAIIGLPSVTCRAGCYPVRRGRNPAPAGGHLVSAACGRVERVTVITVTREFADHVADIAELLEGDEVPDEALHRLTALGAELVPGSTAAAVAIAMANGGLTFAASDQRLDELHRLQLDSGEGPVVETLRHNEPRRVDDTTAERRWPAFGRAAAEAGFGSCLVLPLRTDRQPAGAVALYAPEPGVFRGAAHDVALLVAAQGGTAVHNAALYGTCRRMVDNLHVALESRAVIEQAKGILHAELGSRPRRPLTCSAATPRTPTSGSGKSPPGSSRDG
jgi:multicomponent Na+:H+ antiporter subunit D